MQLLSVFVYFNSIKVQLELRVPFFSLLPLPHFNSIKVQLEPSSQHRRSANPSFQFHKGTIRTYCTQSLSVLITLFQFHKGTIRTDRFCSDRLRSSGFQFHKGTIRTWCLGSFFTMGTEFQFHKGTIRT